MIEALDSSFAAPSADQARAAANAGVRVWCGYLATRPRVGLAAPWTQLAFENARLCGGTPIAFCSGWDDPIAVRALAASWRVRACLDVEPGIRPDGPWVPGWLAASGAGLYGLPSVHYDADGRQPAFNIAADYLGFDPHATWPSWLPRSAAPCGWQVQGTHDEFGASVDRLWLDDWFSGGAMSIDPKEIDHIRDTGDNLWSQQMDGVDLSTGRPPIVARVEQKVDQLIALVKAGPQIDVDALATALAPHLQQVDEAKLEADLAAALPGPLAAGVLAAVRKALGG